MTGQLIAVIGFALLMLFLRERDKYRQQQSHRHDETAARAQLRPRTGEVNASPVDCPIYPIEFARSRREQQRNPETAA